MHPKDRADYLGIGYGWRKSKPCLFKDHQVYYNGCWRRETVTKKAMIARSSHLKLVHEWAQSGCPMPVTDEMLLQIAKLHGLERSHDGLLAHQNLVWEPLFDEWIFSKGKKLPLKTTDWEIILNWCNAGSPLP